MLEQLTDLNDLRMFTRVVEAQSFTGAAKKAGIPKSSVSRAISRLEEKLGAQLLQRTTRKLSLTDAGQALFARCSPALLELALAQREVRELSTTPRGRIRLTAPGDFATDYLGPVLVDFIDEYPEIELDLELTGRKVDLLAEGFDLALRAGKLTDSSLVASKLSESTVDLYASPAYLERHGHPKSVQDLANHDCILFGEARTTRTWNLKTPAGKESVKVNGRISTNELAVTKRFVLCGAGIAWLPSLHVQEEVASGALEVVLPGVTPGRGQLWFVFPPGRHVPLRVRVLVDFIRERLKHLY